MQNGFIQSSLPTTLSKSYSDRPEARIPRSQFRRPMRHITDFPADYLIPIFTDIAYPADTINADLSWVVRLKSPLDVPLMDNLYMDVFAIKTPLRILQDNFKKMHGEQDNPGDSISYSTPKISAPATTGFVIVDDWTAVTTAELASTLQDYIGLVPDVADYTVHNYFGRQYNRFYNDWVKDQNLQNNITVDVDDGPDTYTDYVLKKRNKRHDYFTSALPWLQKGTAETVAIAQDAPVKINQFAGAGNLDGYWYVAGEDGSGNATHSGGTAAETVSSGFSTSSSANLYADIDATFTLNNFFTAYALQQLLMQDARGGTRFNELVNSHFGVTVPDYRAQRTEIIRLGSYPLHVTPMVQTSESGTTELGTIAANLASVGQNSFKLLTSFVEHSAFMVLINIRADLTYQHGNHRMFYLDTRYDFYYPALANLSEMAVLNQEIFVQGTSADTDVWGYQERNADMKYGYARVSGTLRSTNAASLDVYHLAYEETTLPTLSGTWIESNTPIERVSAVTTEAPFVGDFYLNATWARPMPMYSVPGIYNRF